MNGKIPDAWPLGMKPEVARAYVGGEQNLRVLELFFALRPTIRHKGNTTYDRERVDAAWRRADMEGWPEPEEIQNRIRELRLQTEFNVIRIG